MNRRKFIQCISSIPAASLALPRATLMEPGRKSGAEKPEINYEPRSTEPLRIGIMGIVGASVYYVDRVAQSLNFPCRKIAVETDKVRLCWCRPSDNLLIGDCGMKPATIKDAELMARDRRSDIAKLVSGLDVAFLLTDLDGIAGKGVTSVVAETLGELDVFTVAVLPGVADAKVANSLNRLVDVSCNLPFHALINEADAQQRILSRLDFEVEATAQICHTITRFLEQSEYSRSSGARMSWLLKGEKPCVMGFGDGNGPGGSLAAFEAATKSPLLGAEWCNLPGYRMVFVEKGPGIQTCDVHPILDRMREVIPNKVRRHFRIIENEHLNTDYRVTILSRG